MAIKGDIVVGIDGSPAARDAAAWALKDARHYGLPLTYVTVVPESASPDEKDTARQYLDVLASDLRAFSPDVDFTTLVEVGDGAEILARMSQKARMIVIGKHVPHPVQAGRIGTISDGLPGHALSTVLVHKPRFDSWSDPENHPSPHTRVVVGLDSSEYAGVAAIDAATVARSLGVPLLVVVGTTSLGDVEKVREQIDLDMAWLRAEFPGLSVSAEFLEGEPADLLVDRSADADLLVIGKRGLGRFASLRTQLGRTSAQVLPRSQCSVLLVPFRDDPLLARRRTVG